MSYHSGHPTQTMLVSTTHQIEGRRIRSYLGVVNAEAIMGANLFKDLFASFRDLVGGRSGSYEKVFRDARQQAFAELEQAAAEFGNAIVGVMVSYQTLGAQGGILMVAVSGTAVVLD